jgi:hypothetical protein
MERLEVIAPDIAETLTSLGNTSKRLVAYACRLAVTETGLEDDRSSRALDALEAGRADRSDAEAVRALAVELDEAAWRTQDAGTYLRSFTRARAAAAVAFALDGEDAEAIYEAAHGFEVVDDLLRLLRNA